ncbi:MAG: hypothetical protein ACRDOS_10675 [Gaiellaceae bacterium]
MLLALLVPPAAPALPEGVSPDVDYTLEGVPGTNGWFRSEVTIHWTVVPTQGLKKTTGCEPGDRIEDETSGVIHTCVAEWNDGTIFSRPTHPAIKIDWTPPTSVKVRPTRRPDVYGWYGHRVRFVFRGTDALSGIASCSRRLYDGPNRARASVTGSCEDLAGNSTARTVRLKYSKPLLRPQRGKRVRRAPFLDWVTVTNARFYNVQVWRDDRKILTRWPRRSRLQMPSRWTHEGVRYSMAVPGRYDVYVWPRFKGRYGKSIGHTYFIRR